MLIFVILLIVATVSAAVLSKKKAPAKRGISEPQRINLILRNVEVYDGTPKGQKRLEDAK